jgi:hypothetical protein
MSDLKACIDQLRKVETLVSGKSRNHFKRQAPDENVPAMSKNRVSPLTHRKSMSV